MDSNKTADRAAGESGKLASPARQRLWSTAKRAGLIAALGCIPFLCWLVGSGIVWATPASYRSSALLQVEGTFAPQELKSQNVLGLAATALGRDQEKSANPMSSYLLWSSVKVAPGPAANLIQVEARSERAEEARRTVLAVAHAYRQHCRDSAPAAAGGQLPSLIYIDPPKVAPDRVSDDTRMMLGIAGMAALGLLLCLPALVLLERRMPTLAGLGLRREDLPVPA